MGKMHGFGTLIRHDGTIAFEGEWKDGNKVAPEDGNKVAPEDGNKVAPVVDTIRALGGQNFWTVRKNIFLLIG
jgi:hypothetical protein